jgi:hypothetical protein
MSGKKVAGSEQERRARVRAARRRGTVPSAGGATTGGPKQRHDLEGNADHAERAETRGKGRV